MNISKILAPLTLAAATIIPGLANAAPAPNAAAPIEAAAKWGHRDHVITVAPPAVSVVAQPPVMYPPVATPVVVRPPVRVMPYYGQRFVHVPRYGYGYGRGYGYGVRAHGWREGGFRR